LSLLAASAGPGRPAAPDGMVDDGAEPVFKYLLYLRNGYNPDAAAKWPLMVFLHGSGQRRTDVERVAGNGPPGLIEQGRDHPCIVVSPQCSSLWWSAADLQPFEPSVPPPPCVPPLPPEAEPASPPLGPPPG